MAFVALGAAAITAYGASQQGKGGGGGGAPQPSYAEQQAENLFDNSGWNVATGGNGRIESSRVQKELAPGGALGPLSELQEYYPYFLVAVAAVVAWKLFKK